MRFSLLILVTISTILLTQRSNAEVLINEFVVKNATTNPDMCDYTDYSDWIELYNNSSSAVDLSEYYLTSKSSKPTKWAIPSGTSIAANGYLVFLCDGYDCGPGKSDTRPYYPFTKTFTTKKYHTNFKLDKDAEFVGLYKGSAWVDSITYSIKALPDIAIGRNPTDNKWYKYDQATPGAANSTTAKPLDLIEYSPSVTFSVAGGFYSSSQTVTLSANGGTLIYYTKNGSTPTTSSSKYSSAISISATTMLRARCIDDNKLAGPIACNTYFLNEKARTLPVVAIATDSALLWDKTIGLYQNKYKLKEIPVSLEYFANDGKQVFSVNAAIGPGTLTSYECAQMPMQVAIKPKYGNDFIEYKLFGKPITKFNRLRLRNSGDAWATNYMSDNIVEPITYGQMAAGNQAYAPVVVYLNGEYWGIYDLREDYFPLYFKENYPDADTATLTQLEGSFTSTGKTVTTECAKFLRGTLSDYTSMMSTVKAGKYDAIKAIIDMNSYCDYMISEAFTVNTSWGHNFGYWKTSTTPWRFLLPDFDRGFDYSKVALNMLNNSGGSMGQALSKDTIFSKVMNTTEFKNLFVQRFAAHLNSTFNIERTGRIVDSISQMLSTEMADHVTRWKADGGIQSVSEWQSAVADLKSFVTERTPLVFNHLKSFFSLSGTAQLTVTLSSNDAADIYICGVKMCSGLSGLTFYKSIPFNVKAVAKSGFEFVRWEGASTATTDTTSLNLSADQTITAVFKTVGVNDRQSIKIAETMFNGAKLSYSAANGKSMTLEYSIASRDHVNISMYNISGQKVATLLNADVNSGTYNKTFSVTTRSSGLYYVRMKTNSVNETKKVILR
jgi:hypothetical protein